MAWTDAQRRRGLHALEFRDEPFRRHFSVGVEDQVCDLVPVLRDVKVDAEPAAVADVPRAEEPPVIGADEDFLRAGRGRAPEGDAVVVMVVGGGHEGLLALHEPRWLAVGETLRDVGEREAQPAEGFEGVLGHVLLGGPFLDIGTLSLCNCIVATPSTANVRSGKSQSQQLCPACQFVLPSDARYCPNCGRHVPAPRSGFAVSRLIVTVPTLGWLFLSLLIVSEPVPNLLLLVFEFYYILGLVGLWLVLLAPAAYRALKALGWKGLSAAVGYLLPLPLAAAVLVAALIYDIPLKARLELSEAALVNHAQQVETQHPNSYHLFRFIGLFRVETVYDWDGCTMFVTEAFGPEDEGGLAYCTGKRPCAPTVEMDHIKGLWWRWNYWHTNERC